MKGREMKQGRGAMCVGVFEKERKGQISSAKVKHLYAYLVLF